MATTIIGIDCATQPRKTGLALASFEAGATRIHQVLLGSEVDAIAETLAGWATRTPCTLLAIDAPLGWPAAFGHVLSTHQAGDSLPPDANGFFRRQTDIAVKRMTGKQPLDVGANFIARTAHAALALLEEIRELTGEPIPIPLYPALESGVHAIEVYPGAMLAAYGIDAPGYKRSGGHRSRLALLGFLGQHLSLPGDTTLMAANGDALDAALCVLAGADFLLGRCAEPEDLELARKEGWIWVRGTHGLATR